jgi:hypothetical protein
MEGDGAADDPGDSVDRSGAATGVRRSDRQAEAGDLPGSEVGDDEDDDGPAGVGGERGDGRSDRIPAPDGAGRGGPHDPDPAGERAVPRRVPSARRRGEPVGRGPRRRWWRKAPAPEQPHAGPEQRGPQTVAELVALRAKETADQEAGARRDDPS